MNKKNNKKLILLCIFLVVLISFITLLPRKNNVTLDSVSLKELINNDSGMFAIMIETSDDVYEAYSGDSWPTDMTYNSSLSGCIDNNGNTVENILSYANGLVSVSTNKTVYCYLYFDIKDPDIIVTTTVNGTTSSVPVTGAYTVTTSTGSYWNSKYRTLNITSVSSEINSKYTLEFTTDSSTKTNFRDYIVGLLDGGSSVTSGTGYLVDEGDVYYGDYTNATALEEANYGTTSQFYSSSALSTSGTSTTVWTYDDGIWTSGASTMTSGTYYHLSTTVDTSGYYQMCYSMTSGSTSNRLYVYVGGTAQYIDGSNNYISYSSSSSSGCVNLGYIASGTTVKFTQYAYTTISSMSISLELGSESVVADGIRYEGQNPNNYVWYNNELWRIIGVIPTVTENGTENLVKIIRDESIGAYAYDGKSSSYTGVWGSNTLYTLLNSYYWGALDGTGTDYCMGYQTRSSHCDFTVGGIDTTGYYGSMVEYVYWNTGASSNSVTPSTAYANETATQTVGGYVGIMNVSDYGYAYYSTDHSTSMYSYTTAAILLADWLYQTGYTWTMTVYTSSASALYVDIRVSHGFASNGYAVRPVLYLKSADVYIADGDGSISDPYIIGIE